MYQLLICNAHVQCTLNVPIEHPYPSPNGTPQHRNPTVSLILRYGSFRVGLEEPKRDGPPPASSSLPAGCAPNRTRSALRRQHIQPRPLRRGSCRGAIHCSPTGAPPSSSTPRSRTHSCTTNNARINEYVASLLLACMIDVQLGESMHAAMHCVSIVSRSRQIVRAASTRSARTHVCRSSALRSQAD